jgi:hypothetical protein
VKESTTTAVRTLREFLQSAETEFEVTKVDLMVASGATVAVPLGGLDSVQFAYVEVIDGEGTITINKDLGATPPYDPDPIVLNNLMVFVGTTITAMELTGTSTDTYKVKVYLC